MQIKFLGSTHHLEDPNLCRYCYVRNQPEHLGIYQGTKENQIITVVCIWRCGNRECRRLIVTEHDLVDSNKLPIVKYLNGFPKGPEWPEPIRNLKNATDSTAPSKFIKTYLQSLQAESEGLDEIAGMGYRKAIEYLVKDWASKLNPEDRDKIHSSWLGKVISSYFDGDLKEILERATWLGNDQAHYSKLFEEYDITILKDLIDLIMVELDRQHKKSHYIETIKSRRL